MFPTFISILDIQSWWEVPSVAHFCSLFRTAFKLLDFDIEDLEEALLTDGTEEASWLQELIVLLLKGCVHEHDISLFNYQMFLRRLFRKKCEEYDILNPFNTDIDFELLPLRVKVEILYNLCEFRLDTPDVLDELKNLEADSLRVEPIGYDSKKSAYWYFYGTRLYREDSPKSAKPIWQVVCFTITDWSQLAKKFEQSKCRAEQLLYKTLKRNFIPALPRLFVEKETLARRRLLEGKRCLKDETFLHRDDYYTVFRAELKRHEVSRRLEAERKSLEVLDVEEYHESRCRYEMGKSKDKKHKQKDGTSDRPVSSNKTKDAKPVGRQTNNSLASATGQILIEPVSNPHKKKMKTSQVFSQSEEDLQTGLHKILDHVKDHEDAWPFVEPVEEEYAPNYYSIIRKPMDLQKMEERLESGHYKSFSKFKTDFQLIVNNCRLYNGVENEYSEMVDNVLEAFNRATERYLDQVDSSDGEIAVEFPETDKQKKKKHSEENHKSRKKPETSPKSSEKKKQIESDLSEEEIKPVHKKKKEKEKEKEKDKEKEHDRDRNREKVRERIRERERERERERKDKLKALKKDKDKDKDKEKENKRVNDEYEKTVSPKKGKKRKADVLEDHDHKSKKDEREAKIRKQDVKDFNKNKNKKDDKDKREDKYKKIQKMDRHKKSKEPESKFHKKHELSTNSPNKKHKEKKPESKKTNPLPEKKMKKPSKKTKKSSLSRSRSRSRSRSKSADRWSSSPPPSWPPSSPDSRRNSSPVRPPNKKKIQTKEDAKDAKIKHKSKHDKLKDIFKEDKREKDTKEQDKSPIKPKDKHNTLRETIEKLKAKSDLTKLKAEKDMKIYDFPNETKESKDKKEKEPVGRKKKQLDGNKKKKLVKELFDDENSNPDSVHSPTETKSQKKKTTNNNTNNSNSKKFDALSLATEQTLKDINKWLDDTPKFPEFSSASNSPSHFSSIDEFDSATNKSSSDLERKKSEKPATAVSAPRKDPKDPPAITNNNNNASVNKKRPLNRDPTKIFRRKEVQRTIDRLQPGKSKGNLLTNVQNKDSKQEEFPTLAKIKDTKNSLIVKTDDSAPKLSLGSVLDSFGKHKFNDDEDVKKEEEGDAGDKKCDDTAQPLKEEKKVEVKCDDVKDESPKLKLDSSPGAPTPNLSAWFKAFGGPKVQSATSTTAAAATVTTIAKKTEKEVAPAVDTPVEVKKDERKVPLPDPSPNPDSPLMHGQPATRQRKVSTGSSMSERSSFSQDMDSPRVGIDERIGAYPAPYPSPMHKSPSGASPSLRSPLPDVSPKSAYPFNGQMRVGFYQDTVSTKSSPDKSCSPRDNPQSPYAQYSEHVYTPPTTQQQNNASYSYPNPYYQANYANPDAANTPPSYYDTTKPLTDQYQAKNQNSPVALPQQPSPLMNTQQTSPNIPQQASPVAIDMQHYQQPHSPAVVANQQMQSVQSQSPIPIQQQQQQLSPATQGQEKFMYNQQLQQPQVPQLSPQQQHQQLEGYRPLDYGRQQAPPNVEPFRNNELKIQQPSNYPVKKRAYSEVEQSANANYAAASREPPKYINQNIPEPRTSNPAGNQFPPPNYNYPTETHQYPAINIPSAAGRTLTSLDDTTRKVDMSKYTNMGYTGPDLNLQLARTHHYKQPTSASVANNQSEMQQRFVDSNAGLTINNYKTTTQIQSNESVLPRGTYSGEMDPSLSLRGLSHIVDRFPNEESRMLGLQGNPPAYPSQHMFAGKTIPTSASMFSQSNTMSPYGVQHNMYNRQMTELQVPQQNQPAPPVQQTQAPPVQVTQVPEPKPKKKRLSKAAKLAAAAAAAAQVSTPPQSSEAPGAGPAGGQGFQSYTGLKTSTASSLEPSAISLKTASVVPGSAFNFGPSTTGLSLPPGLYGDKDSYPNFLDDFRSAPNYYMAAAAAAHHRSTPENAEKTPARTAHQGNNPSSVSSPAGYPFIGAPQSRPPSYPLPGGPFMPPHQGSLMDTSSPQYLQYLQAGVLHQGLLPPGAYTSGYHPALSIRQPYDSMTRPPWL